LSERADAARAPALGAFTPGSGLVRRGRSWCGLRGARTAPHRASGAVRPATEIPGRFAWPVPGSRWVLRVC